MTLVPTPSSLWSVTSPPNWEANLCTWPRPRPVLLSDCLVVKKGSNARLRASGAIPSPVSTTSRRTKSPAKQAGVDGLRSVLKARTTRVLNRAGFVGGPNS